MKPRVAFFDFASCEGCQLQVANLEEEILDVVDLVDIVSFREVMTGHSDEYDIAFIEGSIQRPMDEVRLKDIRDRAGLLVAFGTCACSGGVNRLIQSSPVKNPLGKVYGNPELDRNPLFNFTGARAVDEVVDVDFYIRGCPVKGAEVLEYIKRFVDRPPMGNRQPRFGTVPTERGMDKRSIIHFDQGKCLLCRRCVETCADILGIHAIGVAQRGGESVITAPFGDSLEDTSCIHCGQCVSVCPVGALTTEPHVGRVLDFLQEGVPVTFVVDPVAIASLLMRSREPIVLRSALGRTIATLRHLGAYRVLDFSEFLHVSAAMTGSMLRLREDTVITSWCPAVSNYIERDHPDLADRLVPDASPRRLIRSNVRAEGDIEARLVLISPCTAYKSSHDFDAVLSAQELGDLFASKGIDPFELQEDGSWFDPYIEGIGVTNDPRVDDQFGLEVLRWAMDTGPEIDPSLTVVPVEKGVKELIVGKGRHSYTALVISDMSLAPRYLGSDVEDYNVVDIIPCIGGCITGGGQYPIRSRKDVAEMVHLLNEYYSEAVVTSDHVSRLLSSIGEIEGGDPVVGC